MATTKNKQNNKQTNYKLQTTSEDRVVLRNAIYVLVCLDLLPQVPNA